MWRLKLPVAETSSVLESCMQHYHLHVSVVHTLDIDKTNIFFPNSLLFFLFQSHLGKWQHILFCLPETWELMVLSLCLISNLSHISKSWELYIPASFWHHPSVSVSLVTAVSNPHHLFLDHCNSFLTAFLASTLDPC